MNQQSKVVFGLSALIAILLSGCAASPRPMAFGDLDYFQVDCRQKQEQIVLLQSMRQNGDARLIARVETVFTPWRRITDPDKFNETKFIGNGRTNWLINQHLMELRECPN